MFFTLFTGHTAPYCYYTKESVACQWIFGKCEREFAQLFTKNSQSYGIISCLNVGYAAKKTLKAARLQRIRHAAAMLRKGIYIMKILIVDDEANIRRVVREYAEFEGYEIDEAGDGMEAVSMAKATDYDVIIMDIMMPRLDGYSACKEIRKTKNTPIIMLSARGEEYDKLFGF